MNISFVDVFKEFSEALCLLPLNGISYWLESRNFLYLQVDHSSFVESSELRLG